MPDSPSTPPHPSTYAFPPIPSSIPPSPTSSSSDTFFTPPPRYDPAEEAALLASSHALKTTANALYASTHYGDAIGTYDRALAACPSYLDYEVAVLKSNVAACHLRLGEWKSAAEAATSAVEGLERATASQARDEFEEVGGKRSGGGKGKEREKEKEDGGAGRRVVEIDCDDGDDDDEAARVLERLRLGDDRRRQVESLRAKSLLRRAKANAEIASWATLQAAEEDYKVLAAGSVLPPPDQRFVRQQLATLPARVKMAQEREMGEMMGKLKELGNGILKPFGLSTDMLNFQKDEKTGGYNMSFGNS